MRKIDERKTEFFVFTTECDTVKTIISYLFDQLLTL